MLELKDFVHLSQVDTLLEQLTDCTSGLIVVAGLDPRPLITPTTGDGFRPGGRQTIFRILLRQILSAHGHANAVVVTDDRDVIRISRANRRRIRLSLVAPPLTYADRITDAVRRRPGLLVIDRLNHETTKAALEATAEDLLVLAQLDTVFRGADVAHHLVDLGAPENLLGGLRWVITVSRVPTLCPHCKRSAPPDPILLDVYRRQYPALEEILEKATFFQATGCSECNHSGQAGEMAAFDILEIRPETTDLFRQPSNLPIQAYILGLAALGRVASDALYRVDADLLRHTYHMLTASERALADANAELWRRLAELEAANQVLQGRTEALISLHDIGQALITSSGLDDLATRVCRHTRDLCGAERAILYFLRAHTVAEVLAVSGWDPTLIRQQFDAAVVFGGDRRIEPTPFSQWPPGMTPRHPDVEGAALRAGLRVPLMAQGERVGLMIVHSTTKSGFTPGEVALLQTFANQAAVAIQRAGLIEQLQDKIVQLEAAQANLVKKERLEREMELARQVQQSVLPHVFPLMPGFAFGARNNPASQVGGDFYDVVLLDGDRFGLVIADVSDKGMPAALYMALTRSLLFAEARRETSPRAVLSNVHRLLLELGQPDMFVTVFYGVVDAPTRQLTYVRAGHDWPLLLREGYAHQLGGEGTFLGFPDQYELNLTEERTRLAPGDRLVLYTDGLTDILSPAGTPYGLGRLKNTLLTNAHLSADALCRATFDELAAYRAGADQYDDMTMLVLEVQ
jgi:serine phosphatase RsbU (regulator of sigma subunit)